MSPDTSILEHLPAELAALPFGSPEFKDLNERLGKEDEDACAPTVRGMPSWLNLTGTTVCNLKCFMCNQFLDPDIPQWFMSDEVYQRVVTELYPFVKTVQFSAFGEPLLTPQMDEKLDDLERTHTKLEMVSNGTLMMRESAFREKLLRTLGLVTFSMDGATRETYNSVRTGAEFNEVYDNIRRFAERRMEFPEAARPGMNFNYIMMKRTVAEAPRFVELVHALGGDEIVFNHLIMFHPSLEGESLNNHKEFANEHMDATRQAAAELGMKVSIPANFDIDPPRAEGAAAGPAPSGGRPAARPCGPPPVKCWFLWKRVYIGVNGEVVPCCLAGIESFGSMMDGGFWPVWNGDTYQTYRKHVYTDSPHGPCKSCYLIYPSPDQNLTEGYAKY
jgi:MoaA/NifB/PqqE/SkfB family radical SAM enzyme